MDIEAAAFKRRQTEQVNDHAELAIARSNRIGHGVREPFLAQADRTANLIHVEVEGLRNDKGQAALQFWGGKLNLKITIQYL